MTATDSIRRAAPAALALALAATPFPPARVAGTLFIAGFLPGAAIAGRASVGPAGKWGFALSLSPVLFGAGVVAAIALGVPSGAAAWLSAVAWAAVFALFGTVRGAESAAGGRIAVALLAVFAVAAALALSLPLADFWWRVRGDSWFQAAVYHRLANHGLPLVDPYFSPLRLHYPYFYHAILVGVGGLARIDPFHAMIVVNAIALAGSLAAFDWLARFFSRRLWPRALGAALFVFGILDRFMVGTAVPLALGLVCVILALLVAARVGRWSRRFDWAWTIALAGLLHLHVAIGATTWIVAVGLIVLLLLVRSHTDEGGPSYERLLWLAFAALAVSIPYLYTALPRGGEAATVRLAVQPRYLFGLFAHALPALALAVPFLRWSVRRSEAAGGPTSADTILTGRLYSNFSLSATGMVLFWFLGVLAAATIVDLSANDEAQFYGLLYIPAVAFAVGGLERLWHHARGRGVAWALVLLGAIPPNAIAFYRATRDRSTFPLSDDERAAYAWIKRATPRDAIFIEEGDIARIPVLAGRDQYWGTEADALRAEYPGEEIRKRRETRNDVFSEGGISEARAAALEELGRPVYVVYRQKDDDLINANERFIGDARYVGHFGTAGIAIFRLKLSE